jgi:hypothetical protein
MRNLPKLLATDLPSRDLPFNSINELSDVFTTYRKTVEPLHKFLDLFF